MAPITTQEKTLTQLFAQLPKNESWASNDEEAKKYLLPVEDLVKKLVERGRLFQISGKTIFDYDEAYEILEGFTDDITGDNTYNYSGSLDREINFNMAKLGSDDCEPILIELRIHRGGDVRGNYTDAIIVKFDSYYDFYEAISDAEGEAEAEITVDGKAYYITPQAFSEYHLAWGEDLNTVEIYPDDLTDEAMVKAIKEARG